MSSTARLGAFILAALAMFGVVVFLIGNKQFLFSRTYQIKAPFDNVAGLEEGAPVRAGGVRIGTVVKIDLPHQPEEKITVDIELANRTQEVIRRDSIASVETEGLLGAKYVAISFGSSESESVRDGDVIESTPPIDYSDLAKRAAEMLGSAKEAIDYSKTAIGNLNESTGDLKSITGKIDGGNGTLGALINDRAVYQNLNATMDQARAGAVSFQENMEALKHNFFLRGFFKKRGCFDSSELTKHVVPKLPERQPLKQFNFAGNELFDKADTAKLHKEKSLNQVGAFLERNPFGLAVVASQTGLQGNKEQNLVLSQARAFVVRQYLVQKFKLDDGRIKTLARGENGRTSDRGGEVTVIVYPAG